MNNVDATARSASPSEDDDGQHASRRFRRTRQRGLRRPVGRNGIDLTDASELDADNVPADEEFDRVVNAPD
jgi:hypothetical protein